MTSEEASAKIVLITGAGRRIGAACARRLHAQGFNIVVHYRTSAQQALRLCAELNRIRENSARAVAADLLSVDALESLAIEACSIWGGIDALVNNASAFYPTELDTVTETQWDELLGSNLKAPFFLSRALARVLAMRRGCIVNITDIHAERGLKDYPVYSIAKAGLVAMTRVLAKELAPSVRVNAVAPGAVLWPEQSLTETVKADIIERIALKRVGIPDDIAKAVGFLICDADYITGQVLTVDGGRTLFC
ncbi:MAG: pteridine reductase [Gammaproteobacteria bacterium]